MKLNDLMLRVMQAKHDLAIEIDKLLPPESTGYRRRDESWTVAWCGPGDGGHVFLEAGLDPPTGAYHFMCPSIDTIGKVQTALGADHVFVRVVENKARYIAQWKHTETQTADFAKAQAFVDNIEFARHVLAWTKHGPRGSGEPGPCDPSCVKCRAEREIAKASK